MYHPDTKSLKSLGCPLNAVFHVLRSPVPQDAGTPLLLLLQIYNLSIILITVIKNVVPDAGFQKRVTLSTLIVGPAGTGDRTRATCLAGSAIHYDFEPTECAKKRSDTTPAFSISLLNATEAATANKLYYSRQDSRKAVFDKQFVTVHCSIDVRHKALTISCIATLKTDN
jgi:hypothetical protein